ncbi:MAG: hypothetical protein ACI4PH_06325 [Faecousia sp.]
MSTGNMPSKWLSANQDKAWGEKFFLIYSLIWPALMGVSIILDLPETLSNSGMLIMAAVISIPIVGIPLLLPGARTRKWYESYAFKANCYIFVLSFFQNYFLTPYFFDVLGMYYTYPTVTSHLEAALVGTSHQPVPLIMYFYTQCFYMTYHVTAMVVIRRLNHLGGKGKGRLLPVLIVLTSIFWAFMETFLMSKAAGTTFGYQDVGRMMKFGTFIYAFCFLTSFPIFYKLDESPEDGWSLGKTVLLAFASCAMTLLLFDLATQFIGHI